MDGTSNSNLRVGSGLANGAAAPMVYLKQINSPDAASGATPGTAGMTGEHNPKDHPYMHMTFPLSVLDLSPVASGSTSGQALRNTLDLARLADRLGYTRYWLAEHHNMPGVASSAPEIVIGHVANGTTRIRVGSGGIMLPNHAPLKVAESFRVLEALHPGRIDLGIGRAPGTDQVTALALRGARSALGGEDFPRQLGDLIAFSTDSFPAGHPFQAVRAVPNDVALPPIWLLGSSDYSAQAAASLGLGFAFAHHINPEGAVAAMREYREAFTPSAYLQQPHAILTVSAILADSTHRARALASSLELTMLRLRSGRTGLLPSPEEAANYPYTAAERFQVEAYRSHLVAGSAPEVFERLQELIRQTAADELMVTTIVHDHAARLHSYELLAEQYGLMRVVDDKAHHNSSR
jgi:luciferase family oxidoreductase group 1